MMNVKTCQKTDWFRFNPDNAPGPPLWHPSQSHRHQALDEGPHIGIKGRKASSCFGRTKQ